MSRGEASLASDLEAASIVNGMRVLLTIGTLQSTFFGLNWGPAEITVLLVSRFLGDFRRNLHTILAVCIHITNERIQSLTSLKIPYPLSSQLFSGQIQSRQIIFFNPKLILFISYLFHIFVMGQVAGLCGGNVFKELQEKYGETFVKLIVAEKSKEIVNDEVGNFTGQAKEVFQGFQNKTSNIVDDKTKALKGIFDDIKSKVNSTLPGGIPAIEKLKGQSINEFSGFNSLQNKITQIKQSAFGKIEVEKNNAINEINVKKSGIISKIDQEKPKIPVYDELPEPIRAVVRHEAENTFADQIDKNKGAILEQVKKQFNLNNIEALFGKISPEGALGGIIGSAPAQLSSALGLGNLGGAIGGIGNLIGGGSGGFHLFGR